MAATQPMLRIKYTENEVVRLRSDAEEWKRDHDALPKDLWVWEDLISRANHLFVRTIELDADIQGSIFRKQMDFDPALDSAVQRLFSDWLKIGVEILPLVERLERDIGTIEGADTFRANLSEAESILTPDDVFFASDELADLRDRAIDDHRAGRTELFHANGCD